MIRPVPIALAALCLALAACAAGDDATGTPPASATPAAAPVATPVAATPAEPAPVAAAPPAAGSDTCTLLAGVDLDAALGEPAAVPVARGAHCDVRPQRADSTASLLVHHVQRGGAAIYAQQNALMGVEGPLSDLGDEAIHTGSRVHARSGDEFLRVQAVRHPMGPARQIRHAEVADISRQIARNAGW